MVITVISLFSTPSVISSPIGITARGPVNQSTPVARKRLHIDQTEEEL